MTLTYVGNGAWGTGKGAPLTVSEHDHNIRDLDVRVAALEAALAGGGKQVDHISVNDAGTTWTVHYTDDSTDGPFPLPFASITERGVWANDTTYFRLDYIVAPGLGVYLVNVAHTTPEAPDVFEPYATDEDDNPLYSLIYPFPNLASALTFRGEFVALMVFLVGNIFTVAELGTFLVLQAHTAGATFDPDALNDDDEALYHQLAGPVRNPVKAVSTDTYTLLKTDEHHYLRCTNVAGCAIVVPLYVDVPFHVGAEVHFRVETDGEVLVFGYDGTETDAFVTINGIEGFDNIGRCRGAVFTLKNVAEDEWDLFGLLADESST